jgi:hypothetical protein
MEKLKIRSVWPLMNRRERSHSWLITPHISPLLPVSLCVQSRGRFLSTICECKFFSSSRNIFKKKEIPPHPIF